MNSNGRYLIVLISLMAVKLILQLKPAVQSIFKKHDILIRSSIIWIRYFKMMILFLALLLVSKYSWHDSYNSRHCWMQDPHLCREHCSPALCKTKSDFGKTRVFRWIWALVYLLALPLRLSCVKNAASGTFLPANLPPLRCEVFHLTQGLVLIHPALLSCYFLWESCNNNTIVCSD